MKATSALRCQVVVELMCSRTIPCTEYTLLQSAVNLPCAVTGTRGQVAHLAKQLSCLAGHSRKPMTLQLLGNEAPSKFNRRQVSFYKFIIETCIPNNYTGRVLIFEDENSTLER